MQDKKIRPECKKKNKIKQIIQQVILQKGPENFKTKLPETSLIWPEWFTNKPKRITSFLKSSSNLQELLINLPE
jgi:hypothetical protein